MAAINKEATLRLRAAESALSRIKPDRVLQLLGMRCDVLERALRDAVVRRLSNATDLIERKSEKLERDVRRRIEFARERVNGTAGRLHALSPQAVLERGYSIVTARGTNVRSIEQLSLGAEFDLRLSDGIVSGSVLSIRSRNAKSE
jgi:exodeoxyribonuclease VII large subunit